MKISDIVGRRSTEQEPVPRKGDEEAEKLLRQKEDIEKENNMEYIEEELEELPEPNRREGFFPGKEQRPDIDYRQRQQLQEELKYAEEQQRRQQQQTSQLENFKITVFIDGGIALPVVFKSRREDLETVFEDINEKIKTGDVITIGNFNISGNKILYIDLLGR